jgi:hypothetical protein
MPQPPTSTSNGVGLINASSFDILNGSTNVFSQFLRPPGASNEGSTDFADLCAVFLSLSSLPS